MILLSTLIARFGGELRKQFGAQLLPGHLRALQAMAICRTEESPVMKVRCLDCAVQETIPHSCGHRSCPHCQHHEGQQWLERQRGKLLPVDYFMVTFTLPWQWRALLWRHQRIGYDMLLRLGWQTLMTFGLNDPELKGKIGAHAVLHTHSRRLDYHPHVHFIVPAGALDPKNGYGERSRGSTFFTKKIWPRYSVPSGLKQ